MKITQSSVFVIRATDHLTLFKIASNIQYLGYMINFGFNMSYPFFHMKLTT